VLTSIPPRCRVIPHHRHPLHTPRAVALQPSCAATSPSPLVRRSAAVRARGRAWQSSHPRARTRARGVTTTWRRRARTPRRHFLTHPRAATRYDSYIATPRANRAARAMRARSDVFSIIHARVRVAPSRPRFEYRANACRGE